MRIMFNAAATGTGGARTYLLNLLRSLTAVDSGNEYLLLTGPRRDKEAFTGISPRVRVLAESEGIPSFPPLRVLWEQLVVPALLRRYRPDVLISVGGLDVLLARWLTGVPTIVVVQVNQPWVVPQLMPSRLRSSYFRSGVKLSSRTASRLVTVSETARQELEIYLGVPLDRVIAIPHGGASPSFRPEAAARTEVLEKYGLAKPYLLSVSSIFTFKNYHRLLEAHALIKQRRPDLPVLVIVGGVKHVGYYEKLQNMVADNRLGDQVCFFTHIGHDDLPAVYANAELYLFPSICETFGLTQTEAMSCGVPVLTGDVSANPEICGEAALYFDPYDPESIAAAIERALDDSDLRADLRRAGLEQAATFSWTATARAYLDLITEVAS